MCVRTGASSWLAVLAGMMGWWYAGDCAVAAVFATPCVVTGLAMQFVSVPHSILGFTFLVVVTYMCVIPIPEHYTHCERHAKCAVHACVMCSVSCPCAAVWLAVACV